MAGHDILALGASAGGVQALMRIVSDLPVDLPAAVFVTLHLGPGPSALPEILTRVGKLPAGHPVAQEPIRKGRIYVAPPDRHLLVQPGHLLVERGPHENSHRPAVDVLFRSAAQSYGPRVVGVVLTGNLDDGTAGLLAVKELGGIAIAQDPQEADYSGMPRSAIENVPVDHVVPLADIAPLLVRLTRAEATPEWPALPAVEPGIAGELLGESGQLLGSPSGFICPDCGGALWETHHHGYSRHRCRTGHTFSPETLTQRQEKTKDDALWAALRALDENADLSRLMASRMQARGIARMEEIYRERALQAERHAATLRTLLEPPTIAG